MGRQTKECQAFDQAVRQLLTVPKTEILRRHAEHARSRRRIRTSAVQNPKSSLPFPRYWVSLISRRCEPHRRLIRCTAIASDGHLQILAASSQDVASSAELSGTVRRVRKP